MAYDKSMYYLDYYNDFIDGNYETADIYYLLIATYNQINRADNTISIEEFQKIVEKRINADSKFKNIKDFLMILEEKDFLKRIEFIRNNSIVFYKNDYAFFNNDNLSFILPQVKNFDKNEFMFLMKTANNMRQLLDLILYIDNNNDNDKILSKLKTYLLKYREIDKNFFIGIIKSSNVKIGAKLGKALSSLDDNTLLDFLIDNNIRIAKEIVPKKFITNEKIINILETFNTKRDARAIANSKMLLQLFALDKKIAIEAYEFLHQNKGRIKLNISKLAGTYLNIKLDKNLSLVDLEKLVDERMLEVHEYVMQEKENRKIETKDLKCQNDTNFAVNLLSEYLDRYELYDEDVETFAKEKEIDSNKCREYFRSVKEYNEDLYDRYAFISETNSKKRYIILMSKANSIIKKLVNGVENPDGSFRPFDIIDYCNSTVITLEAMKKLVEEATNFTKSEKMAFVKFVNKYKNMKEIKKSEIYNMSITIGGRIESGKIVGGKVMTKKEKEDVFKYLKFNRTPLTMMTFNLAKERIINSKNHNWRI